MKHISNKLNGDAKGMKELCTKENFSFYGKVIKRIFKESRLENDDKKTFESLLKKI